MSRFGVDYAFDRPSSPAALKRAKVTFVCRYLAGGQGGSKEITAGEAQELSKAGLDIVLVWETSAGRARKGGREGAQDARAARDQAKRVGMPDDRPIYFAVDFDADGPQVRRYFNAVHNILGHRAGAYGGVRVVGYLFDHGLIGYGWQTYAWSGGLWDSRAQLQQYSNDHTVAGVSCDYDRSVKPDFGQWRVGRKPVRPRPHPAPKPPPKGPPVKHWYDDPATVRRVRRHLDWAYRAYKIKPVKGFKATGDTINDGLKAAVKDWKYLLGYLAPFVYWGGGVDQEFIDRLHYPSRVGPLAQARGIKRREARHPAKGELASIAQALLNTPSARFDFSSPTGGTARIGVEAAAQGRKSHVVATGQDVWIDKRILAFCLELSGHGRTLINCIVNGHHMNGSQHYVGQAVDIDKSSGSLGSIYAVAARHGLTVLDEDAAHFHVHV